MPFSEEKIKYIRNEIGIMKVRLRQLENYRKKISELIDGKSIKEVEEQYKPITIYQNKEKKKQNDILRRKALK